MSEVVFVYVLKSRERPIRYVGITTDPQRRMTEHNTHSDTVKRQLGDYSIILVEEYANHAEARIREKWLKSGRGRKWLNAHEKSMGPAKGG